MKLNMVALTLVIGVLITGVLFSAIACTGNGTQNLQGILQNIDDVSGKITVVTKDGQTHVITVDSKTQITIDGKTIAIEALVPGTYIEIEREDDSPNTARVVEVRLAKIEGVIVQFQNSELTIAPENGGGQVKVKVDSSTQIRLEDDRAGTSADLKNGVRVEVKYDPETHVVLKVYVDTEEEADIEGTVTQVSGNKVTIQGDKARTLTLTVGNSTQIENGVLADIKQGVKVEAKFDPVTLVIFKIEVEENEIGEEEQEAETPPAIPHTLQGRENCLTCHGENGIKPFPADHVGRSNGICTTCHQPSSS